MASSSSSARSAPYAPPTPLEELHILDYLELAGSQYKAARALEMHQTTVCRSLQLMQHQFRLALVSVEGNRASPPIYGSGVDWGLPGLGDTQITKNL